MFDVGFWELIFLFGLALMILGPEKLPRLASKLGHWAGRGRAMVRSLRIQMEQELALDKVRDLEKSRPQPANTVAVDNADDPATKGSDSDGHD